MIDWRTGGCLYSYEKVLKQDLSIYASHTLCDSYQTLLDLYIYCVLQEEMRILNFISYLNL